MLLPKLRPLEAFPAREGRETRLALRDPEGFTQDVVFLSPLEAYIASQLDGRSSAAEIADRLNRQMEGARVPVELVEGLVRALDENLMLESERFLAHQRKVLADFRRARKRPPFLAGRCYPEDARALDSDIELFFSAPGGPGSVPEPEEGPPVVGLVAPHIDYSRGKAGYAWAYQEILRSGLADLYVAIGVAHVTPPTPLILTEKDYATPLGPAPAERALARALAEGAPYDLRADELAHRTEHSLEFQAVMLKFAQARRGGKFKMLPLLASSCDLEDPRKRMIQVLKQLLDLLFSYPGTVCLLAGVDFAHIGPRFGDSEKVTPAFLERTQAQDKESIARLIALDDEGFLDSVMKDGNQRKVCGVAALYAFTWLMRRLHPKSQGQLLHYGHAADPAGGEVTFASLAFR